MVVQLFEHCAESQKVAGSILVVVTGIFHCLNSSERPMTLVSTQTVTEMVAKDGRGIGMKTLPPSCADCLQILRVSTSWSPKGLL